MIQQTLTNMSRGLTIPMIVMEALSRRSSVMMEFPRPFVDQLIEISFN